jgi:(2R)-3-sulfolactate dehydrogenase (NADP+)
MPRLTSRELTILAERALEAAGASPAAAAATAAALVTMDEQGLDSHGVSRVPQYAGHLQTGRIDGRAEPRVVSSRGGSMLVDAADGLAYPACAFAVKQAIERAREFGVAWAGVTNSHHCGAVSYHLRPAGAAGLVALAFSNSPAAMPAWQGRRAIFGTNPIAAVFPRRSEPPIVMDLSLSVVARGKLLVAAREGKPIPPDWAVDKEGRPTTDPKEGLDGMMLPVGGVKGTMLALMVELLCAALTGARLGFEADSFFSSEGNRPRIGQAFLVLDPAALAGHDVYFERVETLLAVMLQDPTVRIPGYRREWLAEEARREGIEIGAALLEQIRKLGATGDSTSGA